MDVLQHPGCPASLSDGIHSADRRMDCSRHPRAVMRYLAGRVLVATRCPSKGAGRSGARFVAAMHSRRHWDDSLTAARHRPQRSLSKAVLPLRHHRHDRRLHRRGHPSPRPVAQPQTHRQVLASTLHGSY